MNYNHEYIESEFVLHITRELTMSTYDFIFKGLEKRMKDTNLYLQEL